MIEFKELLFFLVYVSVLIFGTLWAWISSRKLEKESIKKYTRCLIVAFVITPGMWGGSHGVGVGPYHYVFFKQLFGFSSFSEIDLLLAVGAILFCSLIFYSVAVVVDQFKVRN